MPRPRQVKRIRHGHGLIGKRLSGQASRLAIAARTNQPRTGLRPGDAPSIQQATAVGIVLLIPPGTSAQPRSIADICGTPLTGGWSSRTSYPLPGTSLTENSCAYRADVLRGVMRSTVQVRLTSEVAANFTPEYSPSIARMPMLEGFALWESNAIWGGQAPQQRTLACDLKCQATLGAGSHGKAPSGMHQVPSSQTRVHARRAVVALAL
jgi:hypothetical protein